MKRRKLQGMNICKAHEKQECPECWPGGWTLGLEAATTRLTAHTRPGPKPWFDARDRQALAYVLATVGDQR